MGKIALAIGMIGMAYLGFEYDSNWAFVAAVFCFLGLLG